MVKYIIKGSAPIYKNCRSTSIADPKKTGYLKDYWYFGMEEYSFDLTNDLSKAKIFDTKKEANNAIAIIGFKLVKSTILPVNFDVKLK